MNEELHSHPANDNRRRHLASMSSVGLHTFFASGSRLKIPSSKKPDVSVVLVLFNRAELTLACLRSLSEDYKQRLEIIIVDNASTDDTSRLLDRLEGAKIIRNADNENFLFAANLAAEKARGRYLLFLNNDTEVFPGTITSALHTIEESDDIGAVGGKLISPDGTLQEAGGILWRDGSCLGYGRGGDPFAAPYMFRRDVDYCSGAFLLTRRKLFEELEGFDEAFRPAYYEDTDYCLRLWEGGHRVVYDPDAIVLHHEFASAPSAKDAIDLQTAHRHVFIEKHAERLESQLVRSDSEIIRARSCHRDQLRVLYIDDRVPHPALGSGYPRSHTILEKLSDRGYFVTLYPLAALDEDWTSVYADIPRDIEVMSGAGAAGLEVFLEERPGYYETVVVSRPHNMRVMNLVIRAHPDWFRRTVVLYDAEALSTEREVQRRQLRGEQVSEAEHQTMLENELELASFADSVISVSEAERAAFLDHGVERVFELGHVLSPSQSPPDFDDRSGLLFVGAMYGDMTSNADAVTWFVEDIFPRIQETLGSDVILSVAGHNESEKVRQLASEHVRILGAVEDLTELYEQNRVFIAPARFAAGIPHKIHEAAAWGIPVVATSILAEQLAWKAEEHLAVADDAEGFASCCVELYQNRDKWSAIRAAASKRIQADCSAEAFGARLNDVLASKEKRQLVAEPMLEWTGERFLPWIDEPTIAYEHLHRYAYASRFVAGKRVLDLASGEGYGSNMLASTASSVVGVDLNEAAIRHANTKYGALNLSFLLGSITDVPIPEEHTFDVVVCFEAIEHVEDHEALLTGIDKLLADDGLLIISTPNSDGYHANDGEENPFHEKEISLEEFRELLERHYTHTHYLGQRALPASSIWPVDGQSAEPPSEFFVERNSSGFALAEANTRMPVYLLALASNVPPEDGAQESVLIDSSDALSEHTAKRLQELQDRIIDISSEGERILAERDQRIRNLDEELRSATGTLRLRQEDLVVARDWIGQHERALAAQEDRFQRADTELRAALEDKKQQNVDLTEERDALNSELFVIKSSRGWRIVGKWRAMVEVLFPPDSHRRNFLEYWRKHVR